MCLFLADSLSRWAEALREISASLEEMPGEEGYPTYLASRLSGFLERAGVVETFNGKIGSLSMILSVSPPGGDFTEPVTQACLRTTGAFLMLDTSLAHRRHYPGHQLVPELFALCQARWPDITGKRFRPNGRSCSGGADRSCRKRSRSGRSPRSSAPKGCRTRTVF